MTSKKKDIRDSLFTVNKNGYDSLSVEERLRMEEYCEGYKKFLNECRTERECVARAIELAEKAGFREFAEGDPVTTGKKYFFNNRGKSLVLAVIGKKGLDQGCIISGSHVDSPRLDLKPQPLYESEELALLKTHYYGGIKKYQFVTVPLELHGVVALKNGEVVPVVIGRNAGEPRFYISDLLIHLSAEQMKKTLSEGISAEGLNILIGSVPYADDGKDRVKLAVMSILNDLYGITEEDFYSAELCAVPAHEVSDIGLDRSMIGGYGHDDRVCAYAELAAILDQDTPEYTAVCIFSDKEEVGSDGVTGMQCVGFDSFFAELCEAQNVPLRVCYRNSFCLSADVTAAFDPNFPEAFELRNAARLNYGVGFAKYTGARGKSGSSDASAETVARVRAVLDKAGVDWQLTELGKVDLGGGGTIAKYMANRDIDTIDAGVPVLSMHSPYELVAKYDCYMTYKAVSALYRS